MDARIDYYSFTVMADLRDGAGHCTVASIVELIGRTFKPVIEFMGLLEDWQVGGARGHYGQSMRSESSFMVLWFGGIANHILIELTGVTCQRARDAGLLPAIISATAHRATRIDIAVDIPNACSPAEFVAAGYNPRFEAHASIISPEGSTEYVGSMKSERFARIYRYNAPHPRAGLLRVEHVMRSEYAKATAAAVSGEGLPMVSAKLGVTFGWLSKYWQPSEITDGRIKSRRADRSEPSRVRWLYSVCLPSIVKASKEGLLDIDETCEALKRMANR